MLYPKKTNPLTPEIFRNPGCEYRAAPFWAWNNKLDTEELCWQIEQFKKMGFGGFHMHVRTGLATAYLSEEFMHYIKTCTDKAEQMDMLAWLYDEDQWPSGAAGGIVTKDHRFRQRFMVFSREMREGEPLAVYDIVLHPDGTLCKGERIEKDALAEGFKLYVYTEIAKGEPRYNGQAYLNTLDPASVQEFIKVTYHTYNKAVGDRFGERVPAIFTDEPQFSRKGTLAYAQDTRPVTLPWTDDLPDTYAASYGEDLLAKLPELLWDLPEGKVSCTRYRFHDHIAERFAAAFADQCGAWCAEHNLMLTGHMMEEPTLKSQTAALGEAMRSYRAFQLPGIDILCDHREFTTAKQAQSAVRQYGREGMLSELYGVTNWDFDFRGHKLQGDWQAALGVTVRVPHLSWISMNGEAKRDYPASFNYQSPWYTEYSYIEDHFARLNTALTRGKAHCRIGVIHPVESYWLHWGAKENTAAIREQMDARFQDLTEWLLQGLVDFDFISESLLPDQCPADFIGEAFPVGEMAYETILVPPVETLRTTTIHRLRRFAEHGGRVIFLGNAPALADAIPSNAPGDLYSICEKCDFDRVAILERLSDLRELEIRDETGMRTDYLLHQMRQEGDERWVFICHGDKPRNPDLFHPHQLRIRLRGAWKLTKYDTLTGDILPIPSGYEGGWTIYKTPFFDHDSLLLHMAPADASELSAQGNTSAALTEKERVCNFLDKLAYTLEEPNVLLLDMAEYSLDGADWQPREEILLLDNKLRTQLGWDLRRSSVVQPWVITDRSTPHTVRLRYTFESEITVTDAVLAMEHADICTAELNGEPAKKIDGWYVDKCIGKHALPAIVPGKNELIVTVPYGKTVNLEAMYLLGRFGVTVQGIYCTLTALPEAITFGDITRQGFPFYGGNLTYHLRADLTPGNYAIWISAYRAHLLRVSVDGDDKGVLAYAPYFIPFEIAEGGQHAIDVKAFGCRMNTFGSLHYAGGKYLRWWGPGSWRTTYEHWTYEYSFWMQGVLKSPEVFRI